MRSRLERAILGAWVAGGIALIYILAAHAQQPAGLPSPRWQKEFARPRAIPHPPDNPPTAAKIVLGRKLFSENALSANGKIACATCHDPGLSFADGVDRSRRGITENQLRRHTPTLWNLAWTPALYWDGRASSLEDQARFPMSHPDEMGSSPDDAARRLEAVPDYKVLFQSAFPGETIISGNQILKAIAAFERTLVSPPTRFDRWITGEVDALTKEEMRGFRLFTGRAQCINCHTGFAFTDHAFHDIGLPGVDRGRGAIIELAAADFAFKTPSLRELVWSAPYMHDGSMATLVDIVHHYERGGIQRPSRSRDMPRPFKLTTGERSDLIAFLEALSSERAPKPSTEAWVHEGRTIVANRDQHIASTEITQRGKIFAPGAVRLAAGSRLTIHNDDTRTHNVRIVDPRMSVNSGAQEPGESVTITFDQRGRFEAHCGIHPTMRLSVEVE